jgi:hypothetical protein
MRHGDVAAFQLRYLLTFASCPATTMTSKQPYDIDPAVREAFLRHSLWVHLQTRQLGFSRHPLRERIALLRGKRLTRFQQALERRKHERPAAGMDGS